MRSIDASPGVIESRRADDHPRPWQTGGRGLGGVVGPRVTNHRDAGGHGFADGDCKLPVGRDHDDAADTIRREHAKQQTGIVGFHEAPLLSQPGEATEMSVPAGGLLDHRGGRAGAGGQERGHGHTATFGHQGGHPADRHDGS